jgi:hypothetical protein
MLASVGAPRVIACGGAGADFQHLHAVRGAAQRGVVHQEGNIIGAEFHVALKHAVAVAGTQAESGQGVFRGQLACATVGHPKRVGPSGGGWAGSGRHSRLPLALSNQ